MRGRWFVNCTVLILAAYVARVICEQSDFSDPRILYNGWARLGVVGVAVVALVWRSALLERQALRRRQLAVLMSLLVHLELVLALQSRPLVAHAAHKQSADLAVFEVQEIPADLANDYTFRIPRQPRPVKAADLVEQQPIEAAAVDVVRQAEADFVQGEPNTSLLEPTPDMPEPSTFDPQRAELSAPKQGPTSGEALGREEFEPELPPAEPIKPEDLVDVPLDEPVSLNPQDVARQAEVSSPEPVPIDPAIAPSEPVIEPTETSLPARAVTTSLPEIETTATVPEVSRNEIAPEVALPEESIERVEPRAAQQAELQPVAVDAPAQDLAPSAPAMAASETPEAEPAAPTAANVARQAVDATNEVEALTPAVPLPTRMESTVDPSAIAVEADPSTPVTLESDQPAAEPTPAAASESRDSAETAPDRATVVFQPAGEISPPTEAATIPSVNSGRLPPRTATTIAPPQQAPGIGPTPLAREPIAGDLADKITDGPAIDAEIAPVRASEEQNANADLMPSAPAARLTNRTTEAPAADISPAPIVDENPANATSNRAPPSSDITATGPVIPRRAELMPADSIPEVEIAGTADNEVEADATGRRTVSAAELSDKADAIAEVPEVGPTPDGNVEAATRITRDERTASPMTANGELAPTASTTGRLNAGTAALPGLAIPRENPESAGPPGPAMNIPAPSALASGIRRDRSPLIGLDDPLARPQSESLLPSTERFVLDRSFAAPTVNAKISENPIPEFRQRKPAERERNAAARGATAGSEKAVELGLDFLARHQSTDGRWTLDKFNNGRPGYESAGLAQMQSDTAATGLALLAYFGAGYTHLDGKYRLPIGRALDYLVTNQKANGDLFTNGSPYVWLYSHGIASIALCEAYGMTRDPRLRDPAQRAINFIVAAQHPKQGGWRYSPQHESDTSVSGWQMMALRSGELSGLKVPRTSFNRLSNWLDFAQADGADGSRYVYLPASPQLQHRSASMVMTAEALLMRLYLGWERDDARMIAGANYLLTNLPRYGTPNQPARDAYYWYYATQVMFQIQGRHWETWNPQLRELLVDSQVQDGFLAGSWDPIDPLPDRWGRQAGRIYVTAMHLLMLEVYYRHLPLYRTVEE